MSGTIASEAQCIRLISEKGRANLYSYSSTINKSSRFMLAIVHSRLGNLCDFNGLVNTVSHNCSVHAWATLLLCFKFTVHFQLPKCCTRNREQILSFEQLPPSPSFSTSACPHNSFCNMSFAGLQLHHSNETLYPPLKPVLIIKLIPSSVFLTQLDLSRLYF